MWDCAKYPGTPSCYIDSPLSGYYYGRSEPFPARGPYPQSAYPFYYGSIDVDRTFDLLGVIHNYWLATFGLDGANGQGGLGTGSPYPLTETRGWVHTDNSNPLLCPNWAWYSFANSSVAFCHGMVVPDIVGHEYGHGVVHFMFDGGTIYFGEEGALEESFADMAAEGVELAATGSHDWLFGVWQNTPAGTYPSSSYGLFRDLTNPRSLTDNLADGKRYPDRFGSTDDVYCGTSDYGGIHHNSTIPSYACYLISEGGDHNGCHIDAIGFDAMQQILYRAWTVYATHSETFNEFYAHMIQSCHDLYDATHPEYVVSVTRALQATEMDQPGACSGIPAVAPACRTFVCGDANGDATVDISDAVYLIAYIFSGGSAPSPVLSGDANCDSTVDISDAVYLIAYIFSGGAAPCAGC